MFLGIVEKPIPEHDFNRKIFLERVARVEERKGTLYDQFSSNDATKNGFIKDGEWMSLPVAEFTLGDLKDAVVKTYFLDDDIKGQIVTRYWLWMEKKRSSISPTTTR